MNRHDQEIFNNRAHILKDNERQLVDDVFAALYQAGSDYNVPCDKCDIAAQLEVNIIRFIIESRKY